MTEVPEGEIDRVLLTIEVTRLKKENAELERQLAAYAEDLAGHQETILRREAEIRELSGQPKPPTPQ